MSNLKFSFTIDKLNIVLTGLGELAAKKSTSLILKIQEKAKQEIKPVDNQINPNQKLELELSIEETNLILEGLGELAARVSMLLIEEIQSVAKTQMKEKTQKVTIPEEKGTIPEKHETEVEKEVGEIKDNSHVSHTTTIPVSVPSHNTIQQD